MTAEPLEAMLLEHAQQFCLRNERQIPDLVEEQRAVVGELEAPGFAIVGSRESAPFS